VLAANELVDEGLISLFAYHIVEVPCLEVDLVFRDLRHFGSLVEIGHAFVCRLTQFDLLYLS
jgi:hypothetical protein